MITCWSIGHPITFDLLLFHSSCQFSIKGLVSSKPLVYCSRRLLLFMTCVAFSWQEKQDESSSKMESLSYLKLKRLRLEMVDGPNLQPPNEAIGPRGLGDDSDFLKHGSILKERDWSREGEGVGAQLVLHLKAYVWISVCWCLKTCWCLMYKSSTNAEWWNDYDSDNITIKMLSINEEVMPVSMISTLILDCTALTTTNRKTVMIFKWEQDVYLCILNHQIWLCLLVGRFMTTGGNSSSTCCSQ